MDSPRPLPPPPPHTRDEERTRRLLIGFAVWGAVVLVLVVVLGVALAVFVDRHGDAISVRTPRPTIPAVFLHPPS